MRNGLKNTGITTINILPIKIKIGVPFSQAFLLDHSELVK